MDKKRHVDSIYEGYDEIKHKYYGRSITPECFDKIYDSDPLLTKQTNTPQSKLLLCGSPQQLLKTRKTRFGNHSRAGCSIV